MDSPSHGWKSGLRAAQLRARACASSTFSLFQPRSGAVAALISPGEERGRQPGTEERRGAGREQEGRRAGGAASTRWPRSHPGREQRPGPACCLPAPWSLLRPGPSSLLSPLLSSLLSAPSSRLSLSSSLLPPPHSGRHACTRTRTLRPPRPSASPSPRGGVARVASVPGQSVPHAPRTVSTRPARPRIGMV